MNYTLKTLPQINIIGFPLHHVVNSPEGFALIGKHWNTFFSENLFAKIPHKANNEIVALYTNYEGDYTKPYSLIIGAQVTDISDIPAGMISHTIQPQKYACFQTPDNVESIVSTWQHIWNSSLNRSYKADFQTHQNPLTTTQPSDAFIYVGIE